MSHNTWLQQLRPSWLQGLRHCGLIALMLFVLAGVQVMQVSPLHDHAQHSVDCGLCHVPLADDPGAQQRIEPAFVALAAHLPAEAHAACSSTPTSPYQGRAPPAVLS